MSHQDRWRHEVDMVNGQIIDIHALRSVSISRNVESSIGYALGIEDICAISQVTNGEREILRWAWRCEALVAEKYFDDTRDVRGCLAPDFEKTVRDPHLLKPGSHVQLQKTDPRYLELRAFVVRVPDVPGETCFWVDPTGCLYIAETVADTADELTKSGLFWFGSTFVHSDWTEKMKNLVETMAKIQFCFDGAWRRLHPELARFVNPDDQGRLSS